MRPEPVEVHSITPAENGWRVTVYQSPLFLHLPAGRADWAQLLEGAFQQRRIVLMAWDPDTEEITFVGPA